MVLSQILKKEGFNLRERLNVYGGIALGALVPVAVTRYFMQRSGINPETAFGEVLTWGLAALCSTPFTIYPISSIFGGMVAGYFEARRLRSDRIRREEGLETKCK